MMTDQTGTVRRAIALYQAGDLVTAEKLFTNVLASHPDDGEALTFLGKLLLEKGEVEAAADALERAVAIDPGSLTALLDRGAVLQRLGRYQDALASIDAALALKEDFFLAHYNRGVALRDLGRMDEAIAAYDRAIELAPDFAFAHANRDEVLNALERWEEALARYDAAIAQKPTFDLYHSRGGALRQLMRLPEALESFDKALALKPDFIPARHNRSVVLLDMGRFAEAAAGLADVARLDPHSPNLQYNRGNLFKELGRADDAIACYEAALALDPRAPGVRTNLAFCRLLKGDFARGLPDYEYRQSIRTSGLDPTLRLTPGNLDDIAGKRVLVRYEIGLGDTIQYCRYLKLLEAKGAIILLAVQEPLRALIGTLDIECEWVDRSDQTLVFDYWVNIISLYYLFHRQIENDPPAVPYLHADPARVARWKAALGDEGFKIAVCWQIAGRERGLPKSFPPSLLAPLAALPGVRLISVNKDDFRGRDGTIDATIEFLGPGFDAGPDAFADTAAVMACCDLVISCDTATAHVAGALGCRAWVALKYAPDCRWLLGRADTPFYPTMTLFRQRALGDWQSVFDAMQKELAALLHEKAACPA
jgi:tetratricopeptide (TPR) repeat protein